MTFRQSGHLLKMEASVGADGSVDYQLPLDDQRLPLNQFIGGAISIEHLGDIHCIHCGRRSKKSFAQGYCYPCFISLPQCDTCIMSPERCHFHAGTCRDSAWGEKFCFTDHFVYLSIHQVSKWVLPAATNCPRVGSIKVLPKGYLFLE